MDPSILTSDERADFIDSLYSLHSRIFDGIEKKEFTAYVIDSPADLTRIRVYTNNQRERIGYCAVHRFHKLIFNQTYVIFRAEAGILREFRGRSLTLWFVFWESIRYKFRHPFARLYYLGSFVHPSVLYMISRYFLEYYPRAGKPLPDEVKMLMQELAKAFHIERVEGQNFLARRVGWITRETPDDRRFWQNSQNPTVRFYIRTNPDYVDGNGLLTLIPLTFGNILMSLSKFVRNKVVKKLRVKRTNLHVKTGHPSIALSDIRQKSQGIKMTGTSQWKR